MKIETYIDALVGYAVRTGLAEACDRMVLTNRLLEIMEESDYTPSAEPLPEQLQDILEGLLEYACAKGLCEDDTVSRDLFDTKIMGALTPMPREVIRTFREKYDRDPVEATDWYYKLSSDTDYIRRYRIAKDLRWKYDSPYGKIDITINLSKPEKDPKAIAAAKNAPQSSYPKCLLCAENEGYAGRGNHPARQNHRIIPIQIGGKSWFMQYSPYVYYNEHCIVFNAEHTPMKIDRAAFEKLLDFVTVFPHYFIGSNADLPIVGGSILAHEHFQGGHYTFAMEQARIVQELSFDGFPEVQAGIVNWPMSVIRLDSSNKESLVALADKILTVWRGYSDPSLGIYAQTQDEPHNTITPIARRRDGLYELDLVLRCNITSQKHPLGVFHPHQDKHHIKKENIGLIEVMGLAVLPSRLKNELRGLEEAILAGKDIAQIPELEKHALWVEQLKKAHTFTKENTMEILMQQTGEVFSRVLEDAGVFKPDPAGRQGFVRFAEAVNAEK